MAVRTKSQDNYVSMDGLSIYRRQLSNFSALGTEEEFELARRFRDHNDQEAGYLLVSAHLRLVVKIAMEFQRKWMKNASDLIQEGNVGLIKALNKYDPDKGIKFSYYASFWIRAYIFKFIMDNWRMVKVGTTQAQRKLFYNLGKEKQRLESLGMIADAEAISQNLNVSETDVVEMSQRMDHRDLSLDMPLNDDPNATPINIIPSVDEGVEDRLVLKEASHLLRENIKELAPQLNEKERDIIELRLLAENPMTLREIGEKYGFTRERARQIEAGVLNKVKKYMQSNISDFSKAWLEDS